MIVKAIYTLIRRVFPADKISKKILIKVYDDYSMPWWKE